MKSPYTLTAEGRASLLPIQIDVSRNDWFVIKSLLPLRGDHTVAVAMLYRRFIQLIQPLDLKPNDPTNEQRIIGLINGLSLGHGNEPRVSECPADGTAIPRVSGHSVGRNDAATITRPIGDTQRRTCESSSADGKKSKRVKQIARESGKG